LKGLSVALTVLLPVAALAAIVGAITAFNRAAATTVCVAGERRDLDA
jgi:hypothetical protein